jgi:hypothetical protein
MPPRNRLLSNEGFSSKFVLNVGEEIPYRQNDAGNVEGVSLDSRIEH